MSFLKKLFSKKKERKVKHGKDKHLLEFIQQYKSMDEGKKTKLNKQVEAQFFAERELINSAITRARNEVQKGELEAQTARAGRARKIVNEYGRALQDATQQNKSITDENFNADSLKSFREKGAIYYRYLGYLDISFLPYSKEIIREAIEFLLWWFLHVHAFDATDKRITILTTGLIFLNDFIDFNNIEKPLTDWPALRAGIIPAYGGRWVTINDFIKLQELMTDELE